ncbi:MAG: hypothetical protein QOC71_183 [Thermoplasmata archaeon]|jgi:hypothetical protein|nr:hypothetical protein [Thermoplasmata archaeon]
METDTRRFDMLAGLLAVLALWAVAIAFVL